MAKTLLFSGSLPGGIWWRGRFGHVCTRPQPPSLLSTCPGTRFWSRIIAGDTMLPRAARSTLGTEGRLPPPGVREQVCRRGDGGGMGA
eukprot:9666391-Alexandrium_andersonii.AAC.1